LFFSLCASDASAFPLQKAPLSTFSNINQARSALDQDIQFLFYNFQDWYSQSVGNASGIEAKFVALLVLAYFFLRYFRHFMLAGALLLLLFCVVLVISMVGVLF